MKKIIFLLLGLLIIIHGAFSLEILTSQGDNFSTEGLIFFEVNGHKYQTTDFLTKKLLKLPAQISIYLQRGNISQKIGDYYIFKWTDKLIFPYFIIPDYVINLAIPSGWYDSKNDKVHFFAKIMDAQNNIIYQGFSYNWEGKRSIRLIGKVVNGETLKILVKAIRGEEEKEVLATSFKVDFHKIPSFTLPQSFFPWIKVKVLDKYRKIYFNYQKLTVVVSDGKEVSKLKLSSDCSTFIAVNPPFWAGEKVEIKVFESGRLVLRKNTVLGKDLGTLLLSHSLPLKRFYRIRIDNYQQIKERLPYASNFNLILFSLDKKPLLKVPFSSLASQIIIPKIDSKKIILKITRRNKVLYTEEVKHNFSLPVIPVRKPTVIRFPAREKLKFNQLEIISENTKEHFFYLVSDSFKSVTIGSGVFFLGESCSFKLKLKNNSPLSQKIFSFKPGQINVFSFSKDYKSREGKENLKDLKNFTFKLGNESFSFSYWNSNRKGVLPFSLTVSLEGDYFFEVSEGVYTKMLVFKTKVGPFNSFGKRIKLTRNLTEGERSSKNYLFLDLNLKGKNYFYSRELEK